MYLDPSGELWITVLVVACVIFALYSTSPQIQDVVAEVTTVTNLSGSIATGAFSFGKVVWSKSIFIAINQHGEVNDVYGNTIEDIKSSFIVDAGLPYYEHYLYEDGTHANVLGASVDGFYVQIGWGEDGFRIDGGLAINFKFGAGFFGASKTIDFNVLGYFFDLFSE